MKSFLTILMVALTSIVITPKAEAGPRHGGSAYYHGRTSCGCPIYKQRYIAYYDSCGYPVYRTRTLPVRHRCRAVHHRRVHRQNHYYNHHGYAHRGRIAYYGSGRGRYRCR